MVCDFCHKNEAIIYVEQSDGKGQRRKVNLCFDCAIEHGINTSSKNIESSITSLFKEVSENVRKQNEYNNKMCPVCGIRLGQIISTGKAGCPECYSIFGSNIKDSYEKKGFKINYKGSMPKRLSSVHSVLTDRIMLQNKLNAAVKDEDYEKAAMYRDYLRALEKNPVSSGEEQGEIL